MAASAPAARRAAELDAADPLRAFRARFLGADDGPVRAYLDGNSLGRPVADLPQRFDAFLREAWGTRLIRSWDEGWFASPETLGDRIGALTLGAAPGQTIVGDSTTVSLYKLLRTALRERPDRTEIVVDRANFPTDRYVVEGVAAETGTTVRWVDPDPATGVTVDDLTGVLGAQTAVVVLSHVSYRSGYVADVPAITRLVHEHDALVLWDLCHSVASVEIALDDWGVDYATGCTYKYLNGGPGAPAFLYVRTGLQGSARQPIQGWMGAADPFEMRQGYTPAPGIRGFVSGTPPVVGMLAMASMLDLIDEAGMPAIRAKSIALTEFAIELADRELARFGVVVASPRDAAVRGSHVTIDHPSFRDVVRELWADDLIPDFRPPAGIRLGLSPLSTSFAEVAELIGAVATILERDA